MRTNRKALLLVMFGLLTSTVFSQQSAKGKLAESSTVALLQIHAAYQQVGPTQRSQLAKQFSTLAAQRQQLLSALIQTNPADVLRIAIPNNIRSTMPAAVESYVEKTIQAQGVLEVQIEDSNSGSRMHYGLTTAAGKLSLHFAGKEPTNLLTGSVVRASGVQVGSSVALACCTSSTTTNTSSLTTLSAAAPPNSFGQFNALVIMVNFQDSPAAQPFTASAVQNALSQTSDFYLENSFQQTSFTGDVAGWFTIPVSSTNCDLTSIKTNAFAAAQSAGYNSAHYNRFVYLMSSNTGCSSWWGLATVSGTDVWINGEYGFQAAVLDHEEGHNFGLYHSHTMDCGTSVVCSTGTLVEYGDWIDVMGYYGGHFNTFQKERIGYLNAGVQPPITTVNSTGTYSIGPYEAQDSSPKALKILQSTSSSGSFYYYVELRQALGVDSFLSTHPDVLGGVVVHRASPSIVNSSDLLDATPTSPSSFNYPALGIGQTFTDSTAGVTITPTSVSSTGATIQVTLNVPACTAANPSVSVSPSQSQYVASGTPVYFTVTITDNDSSACAPATLNLGDVLPSGWTGTWSTSALTLSPGTTAPATLTVTSPAGVANGFYNVGVNTTNANATAYGGSSTATYVVSNPVPLTVTVSTSQPSYLPGQTVGIGVTMLSGTSPVAGASVTVSITAPNGKGTTLAGTTGSNGVASLAYKLSKRAVAGTYQISAGATSPGAAATAGASTTFFVQ